MIKILVEAGVAVLVFVAGLLVGAHNAKKVTAEVSSVSTAASNVEAAASAVKKAV